MTATGLFQTQAPDRLASLLHERAVQADPWAGPAPKRQRAKLWDLNGSVHCSVIGTCLTTGELRRVMGKAMSADVSSLSDHDLHSRAVGLCSQHNASSKLLQKALDHRHEAVIRRFARLEDEAAVMQAWAEARCAGDIPGAYWAVLTHPDAGHAGMRRAFGDVHMLSHLVGAANRADIRRLTALEAENADLLAKVGRQQARLHEAVTTRDATIRRLGTLAAQRMRAAADPGGDDALAGFRELVASLETRLDRETGRRQRLEQRIVGATEAAQLWKQRAREAEAARAAMQRELAALERHGVPGAAGAAPGLPPERILYVGGRPGCTAQLRASLEAAGGVLLCHDGGRHDHPSLLPGLVSQADRVAFPVDCVSHDAALAVKRLCRQLNKPWLPLRSAGLASFLAALAGPAGGCAPDFIEHAAGGLP